MTKKMTAAQKFAWSVHPYSSDQSDRQRKRIVARINRLMAKAWDEGQMVGFEGGGLQRNPYRTKNELNKLIRKVSE